MLPQYRSSTFRVLKRAFNSRILKEAQFYNEKSNEYCFKAYLYYVLFLQMYSDAAVMSTFERDAVCVTADCK